MDENRPPSSNALPVLETEHYYMEGPILVFTAAYHLKRGNCCESGCRHCPYRDSQIDRDESAGPA
jgi:2-iminoacetate synthase ThiH